MNLPGPRLLVRIGFVVLAAALVACSGGEGPDAGASSGAGASLAVVTVKLAQVPRETAFDGVVEAVNQATVAAQTSGRVVELLVEDGVPLARVAVEMLNQHGQVKIQGEALVALG